jgi:hypothetical protein
VGAIVAQRTVNSRNGMFTNDHPNYRRISLSNAFLGILVATPNGLIVLISLPAIFNGITLNALEPRNVSSLLWMLTGCILVTAVLVVSFGGLGDLHGRVCIDNLGFVNFTISAIFLVSAPVAGSLMIADLFHAGPVIVFIAAAEMSAIALLIAGGNYIYVAKEPVGEELPQCAAAALTCV